MFDIGFLELLILGIVALVVVGPERLPGLVKNIGLWVGKIRRMMGGIKSEITEELRIEELRQQAKAREEAIQKEVNSIKKPFSETLRDEILHSADSAKPSSDASEQQSSINESSGPSNLAEAAPQQQSTQDSKS